MTAVDHQDRDVTERRSAYAVEAGAAAHVRAVRWVAERYLTSMSRTRLAIAHIIGSLSAVRATEHFHWRTGRGEAEELGGVGATGEQLAPPLLAAVASGPP